MSLIKFITDYATKSKRIADRIKWATIWRETRNERRQSYAARVREYERTVAAMWERVGDSTSQAPRPVCLFDKSRGVTLFAFKWQGKTSYGWSMGKDDIRNGGAYLFELDREIEVGYYTNNEIIAATAIASVMADDEVNDEDINNVLARYYEWKTFNPIEVSSTWMNRLNTTVCNIWRIAPVMSRVQELCEEKGMKFSDATKIAFKEVAIPELPSGFNSNNGDGRMNMSYEGSFFYTVDHYGIAVCKEFPGECLDLSDYETMLMVAGTIYKDITNCSDDDNGRAGAMEMLKDEPEWMNGNLFPSERELQMGGGVMSIGKPESCSQ